MMAAVEVAQGIRVLPVPEDENPMHPVCTNIYLIGERELTLIDTGVEEDRFSRALFQGLLHLGPHYRVAAAAITHSHADHAGGLRWLRESVGPEVVHAHPEALERVRKRLGNTPMHPLVPGGALDADGISLEVHYTPGHNADSVCFFHRLSGILFTGDTILGRGTTTVQDLGSYMASLELLLGLQPKRICPGHGPLIEEPEQVLREYIDHRNMRERQILEELERGPRSVVQLVNRIYGGLHPRLRRPAQGNVRQHLAKLQGERRVTAERGGARARFSLT